MSELHEKSVNAKIVTKKSRSVNAKIATKKFQDDIESDAESVDESVDDIVSSAESDYDDIRNLMPFMNQSFVGTNKLNIRRLVGRNGSSLQIIPSRDDFFLSHKEYKDGLTIPYVKFEGSVSLITAIVLGSKWEASNAFQFILNI